MSDHKDTFPPLPSPYFTTAGSHAPALLPFTMPTSRSAKRTIEDIANAEESGDDDYDDRAPGPSKSRPRRSAQRGKPLRKKRRRDSGSDILSDDDDELGESSFDDSEKSEDLVEINESTGRPVRRAVRAAKVTYEESDVSEEVFNERTESDDDIQPAPKRSKPARQILTLKVRSAPTPAPPTRTLRTRSGSYGGKQPPTPTEPHSRSTRRSSRIAHDDDETVVALTNSGRHVEVVRTGSKDPEGIPPRAMKGRKGIKHPSRSTIPEETDSVGTKVEATDELEIKASQHEIIDSEPQTQVEPEESIPRLVSDLQQAADEADGDFDMQEDAHGVVPESSNEGDPEDDDDEPVTRGRGRRSKFDKAKSPAIESPQSGQRLTRQALRSSTDKRPARSGRRKSPGESSDFAPDAEQEKDDELSESEHSHSSPRKGSQRNEEYDSSNGRRSARLRRGQARSRQSPATDDEVPDLAEELADLKADRSRKRRPTRSEIVYEDKPRRTRGNVDYRLLRPELNLPIEELEEDAAPTPSRRARGGAGTGGGWQRSLFSTYGPFGGAGGLAPVLSGPGGIGAAGGVDSDSSDDEAMQRSKAIGGTVGMTPTSAFPPGGFGLFPPAQTLNTDPAQAAAGTPANLGKIKDKQALADADPLGVDQNVNFDSVGGLAGHIDQLKEMVSLPLLYPEIFLRFHIVPPRGVLFHGPPGTGKTLLARALASSVSSQGRKVTFYMRKGADALSKWVGEAERQLRLLFEEARKNQPSIIFFDEIDGLAPVRSSKQEQIHASIVSTLLALMDGMDGRGQVIVIGATNRPDSIDPALRRPGRFDREFYFPLPNTEARRAILDIHTKGWDPPLDPAVKDELSELTKGYGGADLRALCTEAALNAVQRRYPQIYRANEKLLIDPKTIEVTPKDFMISVKKMIPSSERSTSSGASPLPASIEPLLRRPLEEIKNIIAEALPQKKKLTALEEAQYEEPTDGQGFRREKIQQAFETSRVFRPRLLIQGPTGMGQQYLAAALLNHFEGLHVQSFDLPTLLSDSSTSPESTVVRLFAEVKMHKPSVIYIPNVQGWYMTVGQAVISTFLGLLRSLHPTDPILLLGVLEGEKDDVDVEMTRTLFGYSKKNQYLLEGPTKLVRYEFFTSLMNYIKVAPPDFPDPANRKKRVIPTLQPAPAEPPKPTAPLSKEEIKAQKKRDRQSLNLLKIRLQPIMDQIRTKYKKFRTGVIEEAQIRYLYDEADPGTVSSDLHTELLARASFRPYEIGKDPNGELGLSETGTGKFFYNLDTVTIEKRLSNGYYKRPKDFLTDVKRLAKDAKMLGDPERLLKANELLTNVEVDVGGIEVGEPALTAECEKVYQRELVREREAVEKAKKAAEEDGTMPPPQIISNVPHGGASVPSTLTTSSGPIVLGEQMTNERSLFPITAPIMPSRPSYSTAATNGYSNVPHIGSDVHSDLNIRNGSSSQNGGNVADVEGDTAMGNSDPHGNSHEHNETQKTNTTGSSSFGPSAQHRPPHSYTAPSQQLKKDSGMSAPLSQTGVATPMVQGSQPGDYENDASTTQTTSGKRYSGPESASKGPSQEVGPNLYHYDESRQAGSVGASEIPDTQGTDSTDPEHYREQFRWFSQEQAHPPYKQSRFFLPVGFCATTDLTPDVAGDYPLSQNSVGGGGGGSHNSNPSQATTTRLTTFSHPISQPPVPPFDASPPLPRLSSSTSIQALLNNEPQQSHTNNRQIAPALMIDHQYIQNLHDDLTSRTSGCSVEQIEQVNSALMDTVWQMRGEWNRTSVASAVGNCFNEVLEDMVLVGQGFGPSSWGRSSRT